MILAFDLNRHSETIRIRTITNKAIVESTIMETSTCQLTSGAKGTNIGKNKQ